MVVSSKNPCPYCKQEGKTNLLQYDVGQGRTYCVEGHTITDPAEIDNPKAAPQPSVEALPEPLSIAPLKLEPIPDAKPNQVVEAALAPVQEATRPAPAIPAPPAAKPNGPKVTSPLERLSKLGYVEMPGGDVMMQVRISETYVGSLKEAALRYYPNDGEEAFHKHMQNVMDIAINLGWAN